MRTGNPLKRLLKWLAVCLMQLIMAQMVTFLLSLLAPDIEVFQQSSPWLFVLFLGFAFFIGIYFIGWLVIKLGWLVTPPMYLWRGLGTLAGVFLPLIVALIIYHILEAGNPSFFISMLAGILGFHLPGWLVKKGPGKK